MQFHEFFQLSLEKGLVSNKFNFAVYLDSFLSVTGEDGKLQYERFPSLLTLIAKKLIPGQKKPINILINDYLGEKTVAIDNRSRARLTQSRSRATCCLKTCTRSSSTET